MTATPQKSSADWRHVISALQIKRNTLLHTLTELRKQKSSHALEASMGNEDSKKQLQSIAALVNQAAIEIDGVDVALQKAEENAQTAQQHEINEREKQRQDQLCLLIQDYATAIHNVDQALITLSEAFTAAYQKLRLAEELMTMPERQPTQQLFSKWGPTLAAAYLGLDKFISLGPESIHVQHRQPLSRFVAGFIDRYQTMHGPETEPPVEIQIEYVSEKEEPPPPEPVQEKQPEPPTSRVVKLLNKRR